jgi:hypothetical protein
MPLIGRRLPQELFTCSLIVALWASGTAQSLGDLAREERQKKASAQGDAANRKVFSNLDNPQPQKVTENDQTARAHVKRTDMPVSLSELNLNSLIMEAQGQSYPLIILATFADGEILDVRESGNLAFQSTDTKIVTVDAEGTATALATGMASIIVSYKNPAGDPGLQFKIPVTVLPFQLTFAPSSLDFGEVKVGTNAKLSLAVTNNSVSDMHLMIRAVTATGLSYSQTSNCGSSSPLAVGTACVITVIFTPGALGESRGTISIPNSSSSVPSVILLSGVGVNN